MVSLRLFTIILATLVCRELAQSPPWMVWHSSVLAMLGMTLGFGVLFRAFALAALRIEPSIVHGGEIRQATYRELQRKRKLVEVGWCLLLPATLLATGWGSWLSALEQAGLAHAFTLLGYFVPTLAFLTLLEITAAQFDAILLERHAAQECEPIDAHGTKEYDADASHTKGMDWQSQLWIRLRLGEMAGLLTCVAPVLLIAAFGDLVTLASSYVGSWMDRTVATATGAVIALAVSVVAFPSALSYLSQARTMAGSRLAERIAMFTTKLRLPGIEPLLITSQGRWAGAAVVGWLPLFRKLWLGDALIAQLSDRELDMVVLHELAHVKRRHFLWRTLPVVISSVVSVFAWQMVVGLTLSANWIMALQFLICTLSGIGLVATLGMAAKYCELDADRIACQLAFTVCDWTSDAGGAPFVEMRGALIKLLDSPGADVATWLHPSLKQRIANLQER